MTYAAIQMFIEKLSQLINCNDIPFFNNPTIICERPQLQLLYDELDSMIQTPFIHQHHQDLQKLNDLRQRFISTAEEAEYIVDVFLSRIHITNNGLFPALGDDAHFIISVAFNLQDVRRSLNSIKVDFMSMRIDNMKMGSSQRTLNQSAPAPIPISRNSIGSKKVLDEIFVGIDRDAELIRDKLVEDQKRLDVVSIVGMGGIGKTTLATKVFNDAYVKQHFYVRVWVTVSQTYDKRGVLTQILESIRGQLDLEKANDSRLRELVHKNLMDKRYLIVIDDIWDIETWDNLKLFFPDDNKKSRILLTSRLTEVANHACPDGLIHHLGSLNKEKGWELLCQKVFHGSECPKWSIETGMKIVENCQGLPLALVVIAGVLAKEAWNKMFWEEISYKTGSYLVGDENRCMETLGLSYNHLPLHLRECFLYLGGFPEDYMFKVRELIWLWVAEGFIQKDGNRSLEDIAEGYLMDLINRNLVTVDRWKSNGGVTACKVHDLVRGLCLEKAREDRFILTVERLTWSSQHNKVKKPPYRPERMFIDKALTIPSAQNCRSVLVFGNTDSLVYDTAKHFLSFVLLRVLDLQRCGLDDFPKGLELLVHLRYLSVFKVTEGFPDSICNLWNLQTLIYITNKERTVLPSNISDLVNLRHLRSYSTRKWLSSYKTLFVLPSIERPMKNLQTVSMVELGEGVDKFQKCCPNIKELTCITNSDKQNDFKFLTCLEKLKVNLVGNSTYPSTMKSLAYGRLKNNTFPTTLKTLALVGCYLQWSEMSIIQSLPNLQVLKLKNFAFEGSCWNTDGQEFPQLKFLRLDWLNIKEWKANSRSFPCLRQLQINSCQYLKEIPLEIGDIPTLELIQIKYCRHSVGESVRRIEEDQHDFGNYHLKIGIEYQLNY